MVCRWPTEHERERELTTMSKCNFITRKIDGVI